MKFIKRVLNNVLDIESPKHIHSTIFCIIFITLVFIIGNQTISLVGNIQHTKDLEQITVELNQQLIITNANIRDLEKTIVSNKVTLYLFTLKQEKFNAARIDFTDANLSFEIENITKKLLEQDWGN